MLSSKVKKKQRASSIPEEAVLANSICFISETKWRMKCKFENGYNLDP
jgi:hypothetical protein